MSLNEDRRTERRKIRGRRLNQVYSRLAIIFAVVLLVVLIVNIIKPSTDFSTSENRVLAQRPEFTWESVKSGKFMSEFESYVSDQFFMRDQWITLKLYEDKLLGKKESNGVYLGKDGYLMGVLGTPDWDNVNKNAQSIGEFAARHADIPVYMALVPNAAYILESKMPSGAPVRDQAKDIADVMSAAGSQVKPIDVIETLKKHAEEDIYYKTDHHWTSLGAYYAFYDVATAMNISGPETEYNIYTVADDFQGTLASKSGYHGSKDRVQIYEPKNVNPDYIVLYTEEGEKTTSIYSSDALKEQDKYTVFFGGNHARIEISTTQKEQKNLLLFKDSYANCFVQFLLPYYQNIVIVDPRYFYDDVDSIIENYAITDVLFLYNADTFLSDNSIADVLAVEETTEETTGEGAQ
ncbi:MAG: DHHW family protein [Lachnospiraceae bacterium]|jgi:hypothetical protein